MMFRRDPVAIVFGKDVAHLIHRIIHRNLLNELNAEYHRRVADEYPRSDRDCITFDEIVYNWRSLHDKQFPLLIYNHTEVKQTTNNGLATREFCMKCAKLPKHY